MKTQTISVVNGRGFELRIEALVFGDFAIHGLIVPLRSKDNPFEFHDKALTVTHIPSGRAIYQPKYLWMLDLDKNTYMGKLKEFINAIENMTDWSAENPVISNSKPFNLLKNRLPGMKAMHDSTT